MTSVGKKSRARVIANLFLFCFLIVGRDFRGFKPRKFFFKDKINPLIYESQQPVASSILNARIDLICKKIFKISKNDFTESEFRFFTVPPLDFKFFLIFLFVTHHNF